MGRISGLIVKLLQKVIPDRIKNTRVVDWVWDMWIEHSQPNIEDMKLTFPTLKSLTDNINEINHPLKVCLSDEHRESHRNKYRSLFDNLNINLKGKDFVDLGVGMGESLEVAKEMGANVIEFADFNSYVVMYNRLNGFDGYKMDYIRNNGLTKLYPRKYDVILSRGSINGDVFNDNRYGIKFPVWLDQLERLIRKNGDVIICPGFDRGRSKQHICEDPDAFLKSIVSRTMIEREYEVLYIEQFNDPIGSFRFTFHKKFRDVS